MDFSRYEHLLQICNKANHTALECQNRFNHTSRLENPPKSFAAMNTSLGRPDPTIYTDSGATTRILNDHGKIIEITPYEGNESLYVGNEESLEITHINGEGNIQTKLGDLKLKNVLIVPDIKKNLKNVLIVPDIKKNLIYVGQ